MTEEEKEILAYINKSIKTENGQTVNENSMFLDAEMDSLGTLIALMYIGTKYNIEEETLEKLDFTSLSIKDLISLCKS